MRRLIALALCLTLFAWVSSATLLAEEPTEKGKIRVLLTTGGHHFEVEPFYAMFDAMADVEYTKAELPQDAGLLKPGLEKQYDVIAMYDMCKPGIAPEHLPRLPERFYRVDVASSREKGGTGLGLAIVKHILNRHRGELAIVSQSGKGSTFTVVLDAVRETLPAKQTAAE